jgi:hypothetical protein
MDFFINDNNPISAIIFGYNNNICMGFALHTHQNQTEEETYPFQEACQAVTKWIQHVAQSNDEDNLTPRRIGVVSIEAIQDACPSWYIYLLEGAGQRWCM